ncbi:MAG: Pr6Pr family membrane protein [Beijerinckiaceae bacterium]|jgi:hypothetical protein|nr:Pr6Pr family membrane protein [Beijerinckiaceae bacterium]
MTDMRRSGRVFAGAIAALGLVSLVAQAIVLVWKGREMGLGTIASLWWFLGYFTILTNITIVAIMARIAFGHAAKAGILASLTVCIALVGAVYHLLLSGLWNPVGLHWWADQGLHTAMPLLTFAFWLRFSPKAGLAYADVARWLAFPVGYAFYAQIRGKLEGWYPYPFLDAKTLGYGQVAINSAVIGFFFALACLGMVALAKRLEARLPSP